jgi:hypothetical protein
MHRTVAGCFAVLRKIRSIRRSLPPTELQTLVVSLVLNSDFFVNEMKTETKIDVILLTETKVNFKTETK